MKIVIMKAMNTTTTIIIIIDSVFGTSATGKRRGSSVCVYDTHMILIL